MGSHDPKAGVVSNSGSGYLLPLERIASIRRRSSYLGEGAAIGGVLDTVCTIVGLAILAWGVGQMNYGFPTGSWGL